MINVKIKYVLELSPENAIILKKLLGSMTDAECEEKGIVGKDREIINEIWGAIPFPE